MESIRILGTGSYLPPKILTNFDLENMGLDTTNEWIIQRTGVSERRIADPEMATSDLGYEASLKAFEMAGITVRYRFNHCDHHHAGHVLSCGCQLAASQIGCPACRDV